MRVTLSWMTMDERDSHIQKAYSSITLRPSLSVTVVSEEQYWKAYISISFMLEGMKIDVIWQFEKPLS